MRHCKWMLTTSSSLYNNMQLAVAKDSKLPRQPVLNSRQISLTAIFFSSPLSPLSSLLYFLFMWAAAQGGEPRRFRDNHGSWKAKMGKTQSTFHFITLSKWNKVCKISKALYENILYYTAGASCNFLGKFLIVDTHLYWYAENVCSMYENILLKNFIRITIIKIRGMYRKHVSGPKVFGKW